MNLLELEWYTKYYNTFTFCNLRHLPLVRDRILAWMVLPSMATLAN